MSRYDVPGTGPEGLRYGDDVQFPAQPAPPHSGVEDAFSIIAKYMEGGLAAKKKLADVRKEMALKQMDQQQAYNTEAIKQGQLTVATDADGNISLIPVPREQQVNKYAGQEELRKATAFAYIAQYVTDPEQQKSLYESIVGEKLPVGYGAPATPTSNKFDWAGAAKMYGEAVAAPWKAGLNIIGQNPDEWKSNFFSTLQTGVPQRNRAPFNPTPEPQEQP